MFHCKQIMYVQNGERRHWKLGKGPCGKRVTALYAEISKRTGDYLVIRQHCKGQRAPDLFHIPLREITGGIRFLNHDAKE